MSGHQLLVIQAQLMQDRRVQVMDMDRVLRHIPAPVVGAAVGEPLLEAAAGDHDAADAPVVIPPVVAAGERPLTDGGAAELAAHDHDGVVQQATLLQVRQQRSDGLIDLFALARQGAGQPAVVIPPSIADLHEPHIPFREPPRQQAVVGKGRLARLRAVTLEGLLGFVAQV